MTQAKPINKFFLPIAAPARRALISKNITTLAQLSQFTEKEIADLHAWGRMQWVS